ncbi:hypothetical protein FOCC_FOCC005094 [Frankliniella occidentalis]|nr:hypothetical protein FOCC_FOCC005094 [Frankliniella occidentalis]
MVGCGRARYEENGLPTQLLVCNYGPGGNVETEPLYRAGAPCSGCGSGCSATYPSLCAPGAQGSPQGSPQQGTQAAVAPLALQLSTTTPAPAPAPTTAPGPVLGLRSFFANPTENAILPSSVSPGFFFAGSTAKPFSTSKPFPSLKPFPAAKPFSTTPRPTTTTPRPAPTTARAAPRPVTAARALSTTRRPVATTAKPTTVKPTTARPTTARPTTARPTTAPLSARAFASTTPSPRIASSTAAPEEADCPVPKTVGAACKEYRAAPLSATEREAMLDYHNAKRSALAAGEVPGFKPASDMKQMVRAALTGSNNITENNNNNEQRPKRQVIRMFSPTSAAFSQLAWADTWKLGCGRSRYSSVDVLTEILVCNYGPGGNVQGGRVYRAGAACSGCPAACSATYPGLCATTAT